ncbi:hypothetical protein TrLO_g14081 [Triparma laevis f. longispina]|uniref:Diphthine--ammonia ligase n=1 Tax=Triparma laevis f. longispina TaxID=1714387 RepID=A0A9W7C6P3_9STRA|nr:hypothetical protein TrLO_g14081 [Triparma laevis f. longispina]
MNFIVDIEDLIPARHKAAVAANEATYIDPKTGYKVMTSETLQKRGRCCGCGCRHCPYNHVNVTMDKHAAKISVPALLHGSFSELAADGVDVLFWSGGKDSFLALRALAREHQGNSNGKLLLLTTFNASSRTVAHQEVPISSIVRQASTLDVPLLGVPLWPQIPYEERVGEALRLIVTNNITIRRVCNGDLHLDSVRAWRRERLGTILTEIGAKEHAPLFNVPYEALLQDLHESGIACVVCALGDAQCWSGKQPCVAVGEIFDAVLVERLGEAGADRFGENGEFHTLAEVWNEPNSPAL